MLSLFLFIFLSTVSSQSAPFTDQEIATMRGYFTSNMKVDGSATGFVVAAPSHSNPDYFYHWQRDAGISMHTLQYTDTSTTFNSFFQNYVNWVKIVQKAQDPNGINVLGEPKFNPDGSVYSEGWCRPQNDGPASRAIAMITYAYYLLDNGNYKYVNDNLYNNQSSLRSTCQVSNSNKSDCGYVGVNQQECQQKGCCWQPEGQGSTIPWCYYPSNGPSSNKGVIPVDLNYVNDNWDNTNNNCDLWEEVRGPQFYTYMVQRYALLYGSKLAARLGDTSSSTKWENTANNMVNSIKSFLNNGIISEKQRQNDCSVVVGSLYGGTPDKFQPNEDSLFPPTDTNVLNTIEQHISYFQNEFQLNKDDISQGIKGTFVGRYSNDAYTGCDNNGGSKAHAWILCTNAIADVYYRNAKYYFENKHNGHKILTKQHLKSLSKLFKTIHLPIASKHIKKHHLTFHFLNNDEKEALMVNISSIFATSGDDQLQGVSKYVKSCNLHMSEQVCEISVNNNGGIEIGAHDLTWSYGTILSAMYYRNEAMSIGVKPWILDNNSIKIKRNFNNLDNVFKLGENCGTGICNGQCQN